MTSSSTGPRALVIQPGDDDPLGRFDGWLTGRGVAIQTVRPYAGDAVPTRLNADGLIVLGGDMSSNDDAGFPWLTPIRALFRDAIRQARPTLGICLGAQLLAQSLGGVVTKGAHGTEAGLVTVRLTHSAATDPLFEGLGPDIPVASMHGDAIDVLPEGAALLGTGSTYPHQAFRAAPDAWGVQFHPEITPATYAEWASDFHGSDPVETQRVTQGVPDLEAADERVRGTAAILAARFADVILASASSPTAIRGKNS